MFCSFFDCGTKIFLFSLVSTPAPQVRGDVHIRDAGCAHPGFVPYLGRIRCPKVRFVLPMASVKMAFVVARIGARPKRPLLASVSETTLAPCIRFQSHYKPTFGSQHPNFGFYYRDFTTTIGFHYPTLVFEGVSTGTIPHAARTFKLSAVRAILFYKNLVVQTKVWILIF